MESIGQMKVIFSNRAFSGILAETYGKVKTETGGILLGQYDSKLSTWYVLEVLDPGPKSVFQPAYFEYDTPYVNHLANRVCKIYETNLTLVGLWHRHPGSFDSFSGTDDQTNREYALKNPRGAISCLVNIDPNFRLTAYHVSPKLQYTKIDYIVNDKLIPPRFFKYVTPQTFSSLNSAPINSSPVRETTSTDLCPCFKKKNAAKPDYSESYYDKLLAVFWNEIDYLQQNQERFNHNMSLKNGELLIEVKTIGTNKNRKMSFRLNKNNAPVVTYGLFEQPYKKDFLQRFLER
ncbi:MAG: Mov34/MPN/PAD-1 family protein [Solirubrobacterales bacterium]